MNGVNEAPAFDPTIDLAPEVEENQNFVLSLSANDEDAAVPNYHWEIIGGTEENFFELNARLGMWWDCIISLVQIMKILWM